MDASHTDYGLVTQPAHPADAAPGAIQIVGFLKNAFPI
jgi:hypothetical protein